MNHTLQSLGLCITLITPIACSNSESSNAPVADGTEDSGAPMSNSDAGPDATAVEGGTPTDGETADMSMTDGLPAPFSVFARVSGTDILDGAGQPLLLRSVGLGNWLLPEGYMWLAYDASQKARELEDRVAELIGPEQSRAFWIAFRDRFFTEADVKRSRDLGFNSIRLAMNARLLMPEGGVVFDEIEFGRLQKFVTWCESAGLYVVLDMHAAPGGQTGHNPIDDSPTDTPELFNIGANQDRLIALWTEIARRFAASKVVLGYDLLNEPINPDFKELNAKLWPLYQRIGKAIRAVDPNHILIVEGAGWANDWSSLDTPFDANLVYSFHKYWDDPSAQATVQRYLDRGKQWNRPIWCGEMGEPKTVAWSQKAVALLEKNRIGWTFWPWKKMNTTNNPYSVSIPENWNLFIDYLNDRTKKPSADAAKAILDEYLVNIALGTAVYNQSITCELLPTTCGS